MNSLVEIAIFSYTLLGRSKLYSIDMFERLLIDCFAQSLNRLLNQLVNILKQKLSFYYYWCTIG